MPTTTNYRQNLIKQLNISSNAKRAAYDAALERATTATFDDSGNATYKKDAAGNPIYGALDVQYMNQKRGVEVGGEASGTLRSGQQARNLAEAFAEYRGNIASAKEAATQGKNQVSNEQGQQLAEYNAMYGPNVGSGNVNRGSRGTGNRSDPGTGLPDLPDFPGTGDTSTTTNNNGYGSRAGNTRYSMRARPNTRLR